MNNAEAVNWLINITADIGKVEHQDLWHYEQALSEIREMLEDAPQRIRGEWQEITASDCSGYDPVLAGYDDPVVGYVCSVCHEGYEKEVMGKIIWDFCPNCGADMREE